MIFFKRIRLLMTIFLLGFFSLTVSAQTEIPPAFHDGNPADWANFRTTYPINSYTFDVANAATATDDNYKSAKDVNNILSSPAAQSDWTWWLKGANDKGDITNAGAALLTANGHTYLRFFGDRTDNSGACNIGFWFLKNDVRKVPATGKFSAGHAIGDLLVLIALGQGGTLASPEVYKWTANGLVLDQTLSSFAKSGANAGTGTGDNIPAGFTGYTNKNGTNKYLTNSFFEGVIDLTAANIPSCFASFIVETRQSPSTTAALEDFALGSFNATPPAPAATVDQPTCSASTGTVNVTSPVSGYTYTLTGPSPATTTRTSTTGVFNTVAAGTYGLTASQGTCVSPSTPVTVNAQPPNPARPVITIQEATLCGTLTAPTITVSCPVNGTYTLTQTGVAGSQTFNYTGSNGPVVFTVQAGKQFSITVTNTAGCTSSATNCTNYTTNTCPGARLSTPATEVKATIQSPTPTKVLAAPNPFNDRIRFSLQSDISGKGSLELYNMLGQKVKVVYQGYVQKGVTQTIEYSVPGSQRANLIYVFRVGDQRISGKLIGPK